jgi:hypothetical protein
MTVADVLRPRTNARALFGGALLALLAACSQPAPGSASQVEEVAQNTGGECTVMTGPGPAVELESHGTAAGYQVSATQRALACSEPGLGGAVECGFTGPGQATVSGPTTTSYSLGPDQSATLIIEPNGPSCHLNASDE